MSSLNGVLPSILAGNSVILKHSSQTPLCGERFAQAWTEAGLPVDVFQVNKNDHNKFPPPRREKRFGKMLRNQWSTCISGGERRRRDQAVNEGFLYLVDRIPLGTQTDPPWIHFLRRGYQSLLSPPPSLSPSLSRRKGHMIHSWKTIKGVQIQCTPDDSSHPVGMGWEKRVAKRKSWITRRKQGGQGD